MFALFMQNYRKFILYNLIQKEIATRVKKELQELIYKSKIPGYQNKEVVTHITEATTFYPAHEEHQEYLEKNPGGYCNHGYRYYCFIMELSILITFVNHWLLFLDWFIFFLGSATGPTMETE